MDNKEALLKVVSLVSENFVDSLMTGIEEYPKDFPYTIAVANFIAELKIKNIIVSLYGTFEDRIIDMIFRETSNYLSR